MTRNVRSTGATFSSITLMWDELSCVDRNGPLTGYRLEYGTTTFNNVETVTGTPFTATGLNPSTTYMFRVAAVGSSNLIGTYSTTVNVQTPLSSGSPLNFSLILYLKTMLCRCDFVAQ